MLHSIMQAVLKSVKQINKNYFHFFVTTDSSDHIQVIANQALAQDNNSDSERKSSVIYVSSVVHKSMIAFLWCVCLYKHISTLQNIYCTVQSPCFRFLVH